MRVGDCEREVAFAGAERWKIRQSHNQSTGISPSGESQVAEHGGRIGARYNGFAGGVAEHLITPAATEAEWLRRQGLGAPPFDTTKGPSQIGLLV